MARPLRLEFPGAFYHVMARGNERRKIFEDPADYRFFLWLLDTACRRFTFRCHAYALMPNHYHLMIETPRAGLSRGLHLVNGLYGQYYNQRYDRVGHLFQGRFKSLLVDRESYLWTLSRYIHQNPVKAGLVQKAWEYPWSSCRAFVGMETPPPWLETEATLRRFGPLFQRAQEYLKFLETSQEPSPWHACVGQTLLGSTEFVAAMQKKAAVALDRTAEYAHRFSLKSWLPSEVVARIVREQFPNDRDWSGGRGRAPSLARDIAIVSQRQWCGLSIRELGARYGLSDSGVSLCITRFKARLRKDGGLRETVATIEQALSELKSKE